MSFPYAAFAVPEASGPSGLRPDPVPHAAIAPPFDASDQYGQVHTVLPPEQVIPDHFTDPLFMRADFGGLTIPGGYDASELDASNQRGGITFTSGPYVGKYLPFLKGANSTPPNMLMSPMTLMYPREWQDIILTEHALRGYDHFVVAPGGWNMPENGYDPTPANILAWCQYVKSWGFLVVLWQGDPYAELDTMFHTLVDAGVVDFYIHGKEVNSVMSSARYEQSIQTMDGYLKGRIPIGAHFTGDSNRQMGYPQACPDYLRNWSLYDGRLHLMQQLWPYDNPSLSGGLCSAGKQGASMYYARLHVNCGIGDAAVGPGAPNSRVIAFESMQSAQLYGDCTEEYSCLRSWEQLCGTRSDNRARPVSGFGGGCRYPNGNPL